MTFRFFGDSWLWTWQDTNFFKSKRMIEEGGVIQKRYRFSVIEHLLRSFGYNVAINCVPGKGPEVSAEAILSLPKYSDLVDNEIWVWFISNIQRDTNKEHFCFNQGLEAYVDSYDKKLVEILSSVSDKIPNHITLLIVGGHTAIPKHIFDSITKRPPNYMLMSENIIEDLFDTYDSKPMTKDVLHNLFEEYSPQYDTDLLRRFLFCDLDYFYNHSNNKVDRSIEEFFVTVHDIRCRYHQICGKHPHYWPDGGHIGYAGQVCVVDKLLKFCEDKNLLKT